MRTIPDDLLGLYADAQMDSTKPWHCMQISPEKMIALIERISALEAALREKEQNYQTLLDDAVQVRSKLAQARVEIEEGDEEIKNLNHLLFAATSKRDEYKLIALQVGDRWLKASAELEAARADIERLSAPVSDAEIDLHFHQEDGIGSYVASVGSVSELLAARAALQQSGAV